jgi:hypothetical protein
MIRRDRGRDEGYRACTVFLSHPMSYASWTAIWGEIVTRIKGAVGWIMSFRGNRGFMECIECMSV